MAIQFFSEETNYQIPQKLLRKRWLREIAQGEKFRIKDLNFILCSDKYLHQINIEYLNHDTLTDIITFDNSEKDTELEGDIFVSIERVQENAKIHEVNLLDELSRVLSHGLFHLMGYQDKKKGDILVMREKESTAIELFKKLNVPRETNKKRI